MKIKTFYTTTNTKPPLWRCSYLANYKFTSDAGEIGDRFGSFSGSLQLGKSRQPQRRNASWRIPPDPTIFGICSLCHLTWPAANPQSTRQQTAPCDLRQKTSWINAVPDDARDLTPVGPLRSEGTDRSFPGFSDVRAGKGETGEMQANRGVSPRLARGLPVRSCSAAAVSPAARLGMR